MEAKKINYTVKEKIEFFQKELLLAEARKIQVERRIEWLKAKIKSLK